MKTVDQNHNIRSAKRGKNERIGIHGWHLYYAGYSESFVEDIIKYMGVNEESIILDPWMGSGTTAVVCQKLGIQSFGNELNPAMVTFGRAKSAKLLDSDLPALVNHIISYTQSNTIHPVLDSSRMNEYLNESDCKALDRLRCSVDHFCEGNDSINKKSFFYAVLFRCLRAVGNFKSGSNPTWLIKEIPELTNENRDIYSIFKQFTYSMIKDLSYTYQDLFTERRPETVIKEGNSRNLDFEDESIDYVVTSPPYLTRIDYAVSTKPELLFLGYEEKDGFDSIRRSIMGAPVIADKNIVLNEMWGRTCLNFLASVENHPTKAAKSYYLPIYLQYFRDAIESLQEIYRVLKPGGQASLVVQSSYFKDVEGKLGEMYIEMSKNLGFEAHLAKREEIKQHIAHVNTRSSMYVKNKVYYEDAVILQKRRDENK